MGEKKENKAQDLYSLGFIMNKTKQTKKYLRIDGHMPGRMLRAPQRMESQPSKSVFAFTLRHLLLIADKCSHSTTGPGWSKKIASTLLKSQRSWAKVQVSGKRKNKNKTSEWSWVRHRCKRQNCRDCNAQHPLSAQPQSGSSRSEWRGAADQTILHPGKGNFSSRGVVMWGLHKGGRRAGDLQS